MDSEAEGHCAKRQKGSLETVMLRMVKDMNLSLLVEEHYVKVLRVATFCMANEYFHRQSALLR